MSTQRSPTGEPSVAPECLVTTLRSISDISSDTNIPDMPGRILSRIDDRQPNPPNAPHAFMARDSEKVGPRFDIKRNSRSTYKLQWKYVLKCSTLLYYKCSQELHWSRLRDNQPVIQQTLLPKNNTRKERRAI